MDYKREIERRDKKIEDCKNEIKSLKEEIFALRELLDCAAANLVIAVKDRGEKLCLAKKDVTEALGKYHLKAKDDGNGNYILEIVS